MALGGGKCAKRGAHGWGFRGGSMGGRVEVAAAEDVSGGGRASKLG